MHFKSYDQWTRRSSLQTLFGFTAGLPLLKGFSPVDNPAAQIRYRAASWWLTPEDLTWPSDELMEKIRRRADRCLANGVNCCLVFGVHLRWDFLPVWGRIHDLLHFVADELHQRRILLIDHHSNCVVHRARNREEALNITRRNRHHVPFYPSMEAAAEWQFNGSRLNDWRMIDVATGQPVYLPAYNAEQFCMNNPAFRQSYVQYVRRLLAETGIDGLMSDDGIFYAGWQACACGYCKQRFEKQYGHRLPPVTDKSFWGNRGSAAFGDWIDMRYRTSGDFLAEIKKALPPGFPFLSCCSSSEGYALPAYGMSYQDFIRSCNIVLLEMAGSTPSTSGTWDNRIPSQMLHLGIARANRAPCLGLGYGFFPDTAFFVWALNKFLGADTWFSTLKGRLNAPQSQLDALADDPDLVGEGYLWEKAHPQLFKGDVDTDVAVLFSRATRDYYGQCPEDYVTDYYATCLQLLHAAVPYEVVTGIPAFGKTRRLLLSSALCLSPDERSLLLRFVEAGGTVIATGPTGHYNERARRVPESWLGQFGVPVELAEPPRGGAFPPGSTLGKSPAIAQCSVPPAFQNRMSDGWFTAQRGAGRLLWRPERIAGPDIATAAIKVLRSPRQSGVTLDGLPAHWRVRQYRDEGRLLIHALPGQIGTLFHATLKNHFTGERLVEKLQYTPLAGELLLRTPFSLRSVTLHSPDLAESRPAIQTDANRWKLDLSGVKRYFVVECEKS